MARPRVRPRWLPLRSCPGDPAVAKAPAVVVEAMEEPGPRHGRETVKPTQSGLALHTRIARFLLQPWLAFPPPNTLPLAIARVKVR